MLRDITVEISRKISVFSDMSSYYRKGSLLNFSLMTVFRILVELQKIKFGAIIMGNQRGHVKGNDPQRPKRLLDLAKEILRREHYSI
jgi:hypothetical protein